MGNPVPAPAGDAEIRDTKVGATDVPRPDSSATFRELRALLERGEYAAAVRDGYRNAFDGTIRAYGLTVPPSCSDRRFLKEFLRPDMGRLAELLPELYFRYEPVRFGNVTEGDRVSLRALFERLYSETVLARLDNPLFQPRGPVPDPGRSSRYDSLFRMMTGGGKT